MTYAILRTSFVGSDLCKSLPNRAREVGHATGWARRGRFVVAVGRGHLPSKRGRLRNVRRRRRRRRRCGGQIWSVGRAGKGNGQRERGAAVTTTPHKLRGTEMEGSLVATFNEECNRLKSDWWRYLPHSSSTGQSNIQSTRWCLLLVAEGKFGLSGEGKGQWTEREGARRSPPPLATTVEGDGNGRVASRDLQ